MVTALLGPSIILCAIQLYTITVQLQLQNMSHEHFLHITPDIDNSCHPLPSSMGSIISTVNLGYIDTQKRRITPRIHFKISC